MLVIITNEQKDRIKHKNSDGTCTFMVDDVEYEGLIVGISTRGTLTIQTLDEIGSPSEEEPKQPDPVQQVEEDFLR